MKLRQAYPEATGAGPVLGNDSAEPWLYNHSLLNSEVKPKVWRIIAPFFSEATGYNPWLEVLWHERPSYALPRRSS
jgi:hypothetical protein